MTVELWMLLGVYSTFLLLKLAIYLFVVEFQTLVLYRFVVVLMLVLTIILELLSVELLLFEFKVFFIFFSNWSLILK